MRQRRMAPPRPLPIYVKGPDDDRGRTIELLEREVRRLRSENKTLRDMHAQVQELDKVLDNELRRGKKLIWCKEHQGRMLV